MESQLENLQEKYLQCLEDLKFIEQKIKEAKK